jgi:transcriptional regulator GlxA family with amidase domain
MLRLTVEVYLLQVAVYHQNLRLLETSDLPAEQVAATCGFRITVTLRQNFAADFATSPSEYRRRFDARSAPA